MWHCSSCLLSVSNASVRSLSVPYLFIFLLYTKSGISNTIARIVCGFLSSFKSVNALYINNVAITMGGIATMLSGLYITEAFQFTYAGIFGIAIGEYIFTNHNFREPGEKNSRFFW